MVKGSIGFLVATLLWMSVGCLLPHHNRRKMEREWESIWESWQIEAQDDCNYINSFKKTDCVQRHNKKL